MKMKRLLDGIKAEYKKHESGNYWNDFFASLDAEAERDSKRLSSNASNSKDNKSLNRYSNVTAYDHTRVKLSINEDNDYINANYVQLENCQYNRRYILAQGPLPNTAVHFWSMIWQENSNCIVMVTKEMERGKIKCYRYYPTVDSSEQTFKDDHVQFTIKFEEQVTKDAYTKSKLLLTNKITNESRYINHYSYFSWPDFGIPNNPSYFLEFLWDVRKSQALTNPLNPSVIHCSAGIGRSGTFVAVDLGLLSLCDSNCEVIDMREIILQLRRCRLGIVQTAEQLKFIYMAIICAGTKLVELEEKNNDLLSFDPSEFERLVRDLDLSNGNRSMSHQSTDQFNYNDKWLSNDLLSTNNCQVSSSTSDIDDTNSHNDDSSGDSDFIDENNLVNSALDRAAHAAKSRRGFQTNPNGGFEESFTIRNRVSLQNNESNLPNQSEEEITTSSVVDSQRNQIKQERVNRTRQMIDEIRTTMRQKDLERERYLSRLGVNQALRYLGITNNKKSFIVGTSIFIGLLSVATGYAIYHWR